jgi:hypothetical protein
MTLQGVTSLQYDSSVRIKQTSAESAAEQRPRNKNLGVRERVPPVNFLPTVSFAARTTELPVEGVELFGFWIELVRVAFDEFPDCRGVHFLNRHIRTLA